MSQRAKAQGTGDERRAKLSYITFDRTIMRYTVIVGRISVAP